MNHVLCTATLATLGSMPLLAPSAPADVPVPQLAVSRTPQQIVLTLSGVGQPFFGAALVSLSPDLVHWLVALPPLLRDSVVLGSGFADAELELAIERANVTPGVTFFVQGVVFAPQGLLSTEVASFLVDGPAPTGIATDVAPLPPGSADAASNRGLPTVRPVGEQAAAPMLDAETDGRSRRFGQVHAAPTRHAPAAPGTDMAGPAAVAAAGAIAYRRLSGSRPGG